MFFYSVLCVLISTLTTVQSNQNTSFLLCCGVDEFRTTGKCEKHKYTEINFTIYDGFDMVRNASIYEFPSSVGLPKCPNSKNYFKILIRGNEFFIQKNKSLIAIWDVSPEIYEPNSYCLTKMHDGIVVAGICVFVDNYIDYISRYIPLPQGGFLSIPFLLMTVFLYIIFPDLNNYRIALLIHLLSLVIFYLLLATIKHFPLKFSSLTCRVIGYSITFFMLVSIFWLNVMCLNLRLTFRNIRTLTEKKFKGRKPFFISCAYAFGFPILLIYVHYLLDSFLDSGNDFPTDVDVCLIPANILAITFVYGPIGFLSILNIILLIYTEMKIQKMKTDAKTAIRSKIEKRYGEDNKQKIKSYVLIICSLNISWLIYIVSWFLMYILYDYYSSVWYILILSESTHALYGIVSLFIFAIKTKIWKSMPKDRFRLIERFILSARKRRNEGDEATTPL